MSRSASGTADETPPARLGPAGLGSLEAALRTKRDGGRKLLVPYITGGLTSQWCDVAHAVADAGADALEVGIPFSDPIIDGPTIQEASARALAQGATPDGIVSALRDVDVGIPVAVMTYYNVVFRTGHRRFARRLVEAGVSAAIVPDLPLAEVGEWAQAADESGVETVMLAAPTTVDDQLEPICRRARGFVYGVGVLGVTGERQELAASARRMARRLKAVTDKPVLIGVGVSNAEQAKDLCAEADGVIVGSALVRRLLEGGGPDEAASFVGELRAGIDA